jgi:single-stranded DNA-binding protein
MLFRRATAVSAGAARSFSTSSPRSVARMTIIGNLADTPELHQTSSGRELVRYAVASNSGPRDNRQTSWFRVASFSEGPTRDYLLGLPKGAMVYIEGDASMNVFQDGEGNNRHSLNIVQRSIEVLKRPQPSSSNSN